MTFAEYNTDENFNKPSNAMELVRLGKEEGKTREEIANSLSPLWKEDKKGNVKKALDYHFAETPKEELKAEEKKETVIETPKKEEVTEKVTETAPEEKKTEAPKAKTSTLNKGEKEYIKKQDEIADTALNTTLNDVEERRGYNWEQQYETARKAGEAFSRIDDKLVEQLPTFLLKRYQNGEFGKIDDTSTPEGRESKKAAQLRLAHFLINGVQSKLKNASNAAAIAAGRSPMFVDTTSDYEKYQQSNLAKGMENRWKKYEAETENAIKLASNESMTEQEARLEAEKIANDKKMATKWNMMDARQKVDLMTIKKEIGKLVGNMDLSEIADFMTGEAISGDLSKDEAIAIGVAQLVKKSPELLAKLPDGDIKTAILDLFGGGSVESIIASLGGSDGNDETPDNPDSIIDEKKTNNKMKNPTGNLKGYKALDGNTYDFNTFENKAGKEKLINLINDLSTRFYNGEIDAETFRKHYNTLSGEAGKHWGIKVEDTEKNLKKNVNLKLKDLNTKAKDGKVTVDDYKAETAKILDMANDVGMTEKEIEKLKKDFKDTNKIKYKGPSK